MKELIVETSVYSDLEQASGFYELLDPGCGDYFTRSVLRDLASLPKLAGIHRVSSGLHSMNTTKFPFSIYYRLRGDVVIVVAILDQRRDPEAIRLELRTR